MTDIPDGPAANGLRSRAERELARRQPEGPAGDADSRKLLHELQMHQIELELQNEELRDAQLELTRARDHLESRVVEGTEQIRRLAAEVTYAEERERQSLARDLHDDLGQLLHVARVKLDMLGKESLGANGRSLVEEAASLVSDASRQVRFVTSQLSPPVLATLGLPAALEWLCGEIERTYGLAVACRADVPHRGLSRAQSAILFRAARELLINVVKHSGSDRASLGLVNEGLILTMTVADPGNGAPVLDEALAETIGFGLASVRDRISFLGGAMSILTPPGGGVRIALRMPYQPEAALP